MAKRDADGRNDHQIDLLAGGRIRGRWRSWHATGCCRSPKCCGGLLLVFGRTSPWERGRPARTVFLQTACHPGHSLTKRAEPAFTGISSIVPGFVRARRPRSQVGPFNRLHCLHRLIREGCQRNERCEKSLQCTRSAMEADGLIVHQQRSDASLIPGFHTNGKLCFRNESPTWTAYLGWTSPWERGRPARILIPANSLPSTATPLQGAPNPPLRGSLPSCRGLCGRDARAPRWSLCGRDARAPRWSFVTSRIASTARMVREIGAVHQVANEV